MVVSQFSPELSRGSVVNADLNYGLISLTRIVAVCILILQNHRLGVL